MKTDKLGPVMASFVCHGFKGVILYAVSAVWIAIARRFSS